MRSSLRTLVCVGVVLSTILLAACSGETRDVDTSAPSAPVAAPTEAMAREPVAEPAREPRERPGYRETALASGLATPIGEGADRVWILTPNVEAKNIVVFIHGWTATLPFQWHQPWLEHLMEQGSIVIFPQYQPGSAGDLQFPTVDALEAGLKAGFDYLGDMPLPVVVAGFSHGGSLAFYTAANASRWGLPVPEAVYSIFPLGPFDGRPLDPLPASVDVLILVGDRDVVVGSEGADQYWEWLANHPTERKEYRLIHSTVEVPAYHEAVKSPVPGARETFWDPLDQLVADARRE